VRPKAQRKTLFEMTKHPSTPDGWATKITAALTAIHRLPFFEEISQYPVDAKAIALEFSKKYFETSYISDVQDTAFGIDGALIPFQNSKQWAILYNPDIGSSGRINFTIGHEFGHFLLHRALAPEGGFQCSKEKIENWTFPMIIEKEANAFAASLLMPNQDFRRQTGKEFPSLELVDFLSDLYQVSRTAILLRWISLCAKRAKLVCSIDGYIDWIYSSQDLRKSEAYINPKNKPFRFQNPLWFLREGRLFCPMILMPRLFFSLIQREFGHKRRMLMSWLSLILTMAPPSELVFLSILMRLRPEKKKGLITPPILGFLKRIEANPYLLRKKRIINQPSKGFLKTTFYCI
jgi:IrrE N-terminal-like domain